MIQKQRLAGLLGISLLVLFACSKTATSDDQNTAATPTAKAMKPALSSTFKELPGCPQGTHPVLTYEFDDFNFHRPKYDCGHGFWFCFIGGHWETDCVPNYPFSYLKENNAYLWSRVLDNGQVEMHFPAELKDREGYTAEDLATFSVDEPWEIYDGITLKPGDYPVKADEKELVVIIDTIE
ncbi:MAG: hypothetical protein JWP27_1630 [Flaviaesturariibacter sp.]|nr:hypothetical protein [Flaviaesturariibacter sp.]